VGMSNNFKGDGGKSLNVGDSLSYRFVGDGYVEVKDLDLAAYCHLMGLPTGDSQCTKGNRRSPRKYRFLFYDPAKRTVQLAIDYINSEASRHANAVRTLKRITRIVSDTKLV
jgi:hypothetical protein